VGASSRILRQNSQFAAAPALILLEKQGVAAWRTRYHYTVPQDRAEPRAPNNNAHLSLCLIGM